MRRGLEQRLRRLEALTGRWAAERDRERAALGARQIVATAIRAGLAKAGVDPDRAAALRYIEQPDTAPPPDTANRPAAGAVLFERLLALARRCREAPPDLATASPAMLLAAYCFE